MGLPPETAQVCSLVCARCKRRREQRRVKLEEEDPPLFPGKADRTPLDGDRFPDCASVGAFFPSEKAALGQGPVRGRRTLGRGIDGAVP